MRSMRALIRRAGIDPSQYAGHSLRIGGATMLKAAGVGTDLIKILGRWTSDAYTLYVRHTPAELAATLRKLPLAKEGVPQSALLSPEDTSSWAARMVLTTS